MLRGLIEQNVIQNVKDRYELLKEGINRMRRVVAQLHQPVAKVKIVKQVVHQLYKTSRLHQKKNVYQK